MKKIIIITMILAFSSGLKSQGYVILNAKFNEYSSSFAQSSQPDTVNLYNAFCEASNPHEIDTTIFRYENDTLYIRNAHNGICYADNYRAILQRKSDTLKIEIVNILGGADCTGDCSMGYTIKIPQVSFDSLKVKIQNENFTVKKSDIIMSAEKALLKDVVVYPNPVRNGAVRFIHIDFEVLELYNSSGQIILSKDVTGLQSVEVETQNFPAAVYYYIFKKKSVVTERGKLVVQ